VQYSKRRLCSASPVSNRQEENSSRTEATGVRAVGGPVYNQNCSWVTFETWFQVVYCEKKPLLTEKQKERDVCVVKNTSTLGKYSMVR